ncbi:ABC transporter ATP-binding protein [Petrotoga sp. 9PWA.NaAc.5.4]|uniref:ABC transporter ATP-binding protein n=1 Tax=Petrotoga sp. 9PWA.NaAc.5.4 TaxID=1434328 RepID=UPI000CB9F705|nr:ABC transporter ATP-binding protein [Petrotoga sp. 9PWA.NaAc.5.4]PNR95966.1 ABC transporter [Petrotoga sp. 9PWA.NaAc.5.4]
MNIMETKNLTKRFGGLIAINNVNLTLNENEILGIIGPNGAGKTTFVNLIAGLTYPSEGEIIFKNQNIETLPSHVRNRMGIARTFQLVRSIRNFTALENIMVGALFGAGEKLNDARKTAYEICELLELKRTNFLVDKLTVLDLKKVEIGRALASKPNILFLDEVMAGLNSDETWQMITLVKKLRDTGLTIVIIEHVMGVIKELTDRVVVLESGTIIAEGIYEEVSKDPKVVSAYLGEED